MLVKRMIAKKPEELWITNTSLRQDITLSDLRTTIRRGQSINLLARKKNGRPRYFITRDMIDKSIESGDIYKKSNLIKIRKVPPIVFSHHLDIVGTDKTGPINRASTRLMRKQTEIEEPDFPDLEIDDFDDAALERYAAENADADFADRQPALAVDPKYKKPTVDDE